MKLIFCIDDKNGMMFFGKRQRGERADFVSKKSSNFDSFVYGREMTVEELADKLNSNADFLKITGGGVTISGGAPMMQSEFVCALADALPDMHKAIQTSGYTDFKTYKKVIDKFDYIMQDIKLLDREQHKKYTGVYNDNILENIKYLKESGKEYIFRVPLIPDITDTEENLKAISELVGDSLVELLPYNNLAGAKYEMLDMEYSLGSDGNRDADFTKYFKNATMR